MTATTNHLVAAASEIAALAETAAASFDGISWDTDPSTLLAMVEAGRVVMADEDLTAGRYWSVDGSHESQTLEREWRDLLAEVDAADKDDDGAYPSEVVDNARRMAEAEESAVTESSDSAAELGRKAAELVDAGQWSDAIKAAEQAAQIEREFGDAPAWGGLADAIRALPEYRAAEQADEDYQGDSRSDDEIAASNTEEEALRSLAGLINAVGEAKLESWGDRYVAAYRAEIAGWCAA